MGEQALRRTRSPEKITLTDSVLRSGFRRGYIPEGFDQVRSAQPPIIDGQDIWLTPRDWSRPP